MDQDPIQVNRRTYDQIAGQFAAKIPVMDERLIAKASRLIEGIRPNERILDLGCGPGRDLSWFQEKGIQAVGADLSFGMLSEARRTARSGLCQMEMRRLGFASQSFADVWCNAALIHLPKDNVPKALAEIFRVLVPGGRFFVSMQKGQGEGWENTPDGRIIRFFARYNAQEMLGILRTAGFKTIEQDEYEFGRTWLWFETVRMKS